MSLYEFYDKLNELIKTTLAEIMSTGEDVFPAVIKSKLTEVLKNAMETMEDAPEMSDSERNMVIKVVRRGVRSCAVMLKLGYNRFFSTTTYSDAAGVVSTISDAGTIKPPPIG
jgi:hypothetical protein